MNWKHGIKRIVWIISIVVGLGVAGLFLNQQLHKAKKEGNDKMAHKNNNNKASETNADGIRAKMCDDIFEEFEQLVKNQITPWAFFNSGAGDVKTFDSKSISFSGGFSGSKRELFLKSYIEPFIEDVIKRKIDETVKLAKDKNVPLTMVLYSTKANLSGGIDRAYKEMQRIDRQLRGGGNPKSVAVQDVSAEIKTMNDFLDRKIKIAEDLNYGMLKVEKTKLQSCKDWCHNNPIIVVLIIIFIFVTCLATFKESIFKLLDWNVKSAEKTKDRNSNIFAEVSKDGEILNLNFNLKRNASLI